MASARKLMLARNGFRSFSGPTMNRLRQPWRPSEPYRPILDLNDVLRSKRNLGALYEIEICARLVRRRLVLKNSDVRAVIERFRHDDPHALNLHTHTAVVLVPLQHEE